MFQSIFKSDTDGNRRMIGYARGNYTSSADDETAVSTTEENLAMIFEEAKAAGETLDGADASIDAAVEEPLAYQDFLILKNGEIVFDGGYTREEK